MKTCLPHILIVGPRGVGKSTLICALLQAVRLPVDGVITKKEAALPDGFSPVYIHRFGAPHRFDVQNRIGLCSSGHSISFPEAFEQFAESISFSPDHAIVFDELGFLESNSPRFIQAVLQALDDAPLVIAAVRDKDTPFLNAVRNHPRAEVYRITAENRDALRETLLRELSERFRCVTLPDPPAKPSPRATVSAASCPKARTFPCS